MGEGRLTSEGKGAVNVTTLTTTLVLKVGATHRDQSADTEVFRIKNVSLVGGCTRHTHGVSIHDLHNTEVGLKQRHAQGDLLGTCVLVDLISGLSSGSFSTGEVGDNLAEGHVGHTGKVAHFTSLGVDATKDVVQITLSECAGLNRSSRGAVGGGDIAGASRVDPVTKTTQLVGVHTIFGLTVVVGANRKLNVTLDLAHGLSFSLSNIGRANGADSFLQVRHKVVAAELLNVVAETSAGSELVGERGHVTTFVDAGSIRSSKLVNSPLVESRLSCTLSTKGGNGGFFGSKNGKDVTKILTVAYCRTSRGSAGRGTGAISITECHCISRLGLGGFCHLISN